jgi:hypothetical protein
MKQTTNTLCAVLLLAACTVSASAQKVQKTALFRRYPSTIEISATQLNQLFEAKQGQSKSLSLQGGLAISGPVISNVVKYSNLQTMAIRLPAFNNILFALAKRKEADNSIVFTGHLFSREFADGYELKRISADTYQLVKVQMAEMLPTCNQ